MKKFSWATVVWISFTLASALAGVFLLLVVLSPFPTVKLVVDGLASDGQVESFTLERFNGLRAPLFLVGLILLFLSLGFFLFRRRIRLHLAALPTILARGRRIFVRDLWQIDRQIRSAGYDRRYLYALLALTILALLVRLAYLSQPMRYDEAYTFLVFARRPLSFILTDYHVPNNHILHTLLVGLSYRLFGNHPWAIRLPAFTAGVLMIPATYLLGRLAYGKWAGLLAAALVASASFLVEYSTDARGYTLLSLVTVLLFALAFYLKDHRSVVGWTAFILFTALGFYTLPILLYPFGALFLWLLLSAVFGDVGAEYAGTFLQTLFLATGLAGGLTLVLYAPVVIESGVGVLVGNTFVKPLEASRFGGELWGSFISTWRSWTRDWPAWLGWVLASGFCLSLIFHRAQARQRLPLSLTVLLWCGAMLLVQRVAPWPRVWLFLMPLFFIWAAAGLVALLGRIFPGHHPGWEWVGILAVLAAGVMLSWNTYQRETILDSGQTGTLRDAEAITLYLQDHLHAGDVVVSIPPSNYPLRYYFDYYGLADEYLYRPRLGSDFARALIVVNRRHAQTLEEVLRDARLGQFIDPAQAAVVQQFNGAVLYAFNHPDPPDR